MFLRTSPVSPTLQKISRIPDINVQGRSEGSGPLQISLCSFNSGFYEKMILRIYNERFYRIISYVFIHLSYYLFLIKTPRCVKLFLNAYSPFEFSGIFWVYVKTLTSVPSSVLEYEKILFLLSQSTSQFPFLKYLRDASSLFQHCFTNYCISSSILTIISFWFQFSELKEKRLKLLTVGKQKIFVLTRCDILPIDKSRCFVLPIIMQMNYQCELQVIIFVFLRERHVRQAQRRSRNESTCGQPPRKIIRNDHKHEGRDINTAKIIADPQRLHHTAFLRQQRIRQGTEFIFT